MIEDPSLPLPGPSAPPDAPQALDGPSDRLAVASPATARPFLLASGSTRAVGVETTGVDQIHAGGSAGPLLLARPALQPRPLAEGARAAPAANVVASPRAIRRETVDAGGSVVETVLLPERLPGALVEWRVRSARGRAPADGASPGLHLSFELPRPAAYRAAGERLVLRAPGDGAVRLVRVVPAPSSWRVEEAGGDRVRVLATVTPDRADPRQTRVTLLAVLADDADEAAARLERCARVRLHERRADEALRTSREGLLALHSGVAGMDDGLEWAKARMTSLGANEAGHPPEAHALEILGLASVGAHVRAAERLEAMGATAPSTLSAHAWLAHGAYASWSGRPHPEAADRERLLDAARSLRTTGGSRSRLRRATLRAVADLLDALGRRDDAEEVRGGIGRAVRLPTVGSGAPGRAADPLATFALGRAGRSGAARHAAPSARALRAWSLYASDAPDDAYPLLRAHLGDAARGTPEGWLDDPLAFFLTPVALLYGLFGARPDAPVGRLRLAPALPAPWTSVELRNVRLGDATLDVGYTREGGPSTFVLRPTGGAVPATVVFEPRTPARVARVLVDGEPAEVEIRPAGPRTAVRLQLPIDRERRVTLVGTDD